MPMAEAPAATFRAVKAEILRRIRARAWSPGAVLPRETELAAEFGCARATVNRALRELAEDGVLDRRRRAGTRVSPSGAGRPRIEIPLIRAEIEARGAAYGYRLLRRAEGPAPDWLAVRLGLPAAARVLEVEALHLADAQPWQHERRWISLAAVPAAAAQSFERTGANEWLVAEVPASEAEIAFSAVGAEPAVAAVLGVPAGSALFRTERTTWLDGRAVTHAVLTHAPGFRLVTRL
jgi:GntR family histidine utilization transcriptional repressor